MISALKNFGRRIPDLDPAKLLALQGLDAAGIERSIRARFDDMRGVRREAA